MRRGAKFGRFEQRGATRLVRALGALLFAISVLVQLATPAGAASAHGVYCAKPIANASATDHPNSADGRSGALDRCDHCAIGQAPALPAAIAEGHTKRQIKACATPHASWTDPGGREPTNPSLARAPPAFS